MFVPKEEDKGKTHILRNGSVICNQCEDNKKCNGCYFDHICNSWVINHKGPREFYP